MKQEISEAVEIIAAAIIRFGIRRKLCGTEPEVKAKKQPGFSGSRPKGSLRKNHKRGEGAHGSR